MPAYFLPTFFVAWCVGMAYVVTLLMVMSKVDRLENPGAPAKTFWTGFSPDYALKALRFLFSGRHKAFEDHQLSRLVMICRTLLATCVPLYAYVFWQVWFLR